MKELPDYFTVGQLKQLLAALPDDLPIGVIGHFGEFEPMDSSNFRQRQANPIPKGGYWRDMLPEKIGVLCITTPDVGPEPD